jgi:PAS domain S-box-containing protein
MDQMYQEHQQLLESQVALEASRDRYVELFDYAPVGYMILNNAGLILAVNSVGTRILGRERRKLVGWPMVGFIHRPDRRKFINHLRLCAGREGACITTELRLAIESGTPAGWVELLSVSNRVGVNGLRAETPTLKCAFTDISARKTSEQALQESEARFHSLADSAPVLIWISDSDKRRTYVNQRWLDFTGRTMEQEVGSGWLEGLHADDIRRWQHLYDRSFAHRKEFRIEFQLQRHDGEYRWMLDYGVPQFGAQKEFLGFIGSCVDITERKKLENALAEAGRLPNENPSPVMRLDQGIVIAYANPAAQQMMRHWRAAPGRKAPAEVVRVAIRALAADEGQLLDLAIGNRIFQISVVPFRTGGYVNLYFSDITQRKKAETLLIEAREHLERRVQQRTQQLRRANAVLRTAILAQKEVERELRESEERLNLIVEGTRDYAIMMLDAAGRVVSWNSAGKQITGYRAAEMQGRHFSCFYAPADIQRRLPQRLMQLAKVEGRADTEGWRIRKNGTRFWASVVISALHDKAGRLRGFSKIVRDISERRAAQEALERSERNLTDFFNESPLGFFWVGPKGKILRVNTAGLALLELKVADRVQHYIQECEADSGAIEAVLKLLARGHQIQSTRVRLRSKAGRIRHALIDANGLWDNRRLTHSRWFVRDISRQVELEREILVVTERERRWIGHELHDDLCQQLAGIEFLSQTLAARLSTPSPADAVRARDMARMVRTAMDRTRELAHGLSPVQLDSLGLTGALEELASRTRKVFKVDCRFRCNTRALSHDPVLGINLYRIAQEAVSNALKHGHAKSIRIALIRNRYQLVLAVSDNGVGVRLNSRKTKGSGLRVMQYRAGAIQGNIAVRRNRQGGTTVSCTIMNTFVKGAIKRSGR